MILCACVEERETESEEGEGKKKILDSPPIRDTDTGDTVNDFKVQSENIIQYDATSKGAQNYLSLAQEVLNKNK